MRDGGTRVGRLAPVSRLIGCAYWVGVWDVGLHQPLTQVGAGTPRYENWGSGWRVLYTAPRDLGWVPDRRERGTSPSLRVVFDRAKLPIPAPPGFRPRIGVRGRLFAGVSVLDVKGFQVPGAYSSVQGVPRCATECSCNSSLRITATNATFPGFPRLRSCW